MHYIVAHFGHVPYGKTLMGNVYYANPNDGCTSLNRTNMNWHEENENDPSNVPIVFLDRGNCTFVTKTKMAQMVGAKMVIIADNKAEENITGIIMADDGHGQSLNIPTIMIGKADADKIRNYIVSNPDQTITMVASFPAKGEVNDVTAEFWFSAADSSAYPFISDFAQFVATFDEESVKITPHYVLWYCAECRMKGYDGSPQSNCLSGGRFCAPDPDGKGPAEGQTVVTEDLRQICVYRELKALAWWKYTSEFGQNCLSWENLECYKEAMKNAGFSSDDQAKVHDCMEKSFDSLNPVYAKDNNRLLQHEMDSYGDSGIQYWPSITINHVPYKGELTPGIKVAEAICEKFSPDKPDFCTAIEKQSDIAAGNVEDASTHYLAIFFILLAMIAVLLLMLYFYKRMMRREMTKEMSIQISQMVSQYFALNEGKAGKGDNL
jgi:hypothetical protein